MSILAVASWRGQSALANLMQVSSRVFITAYSEEYSFSSC